MKITEIMNQAYLFADTIVFKDSAKQRTYEEAKLIFGSGIQKSYIENFIAGAIIAYHDSLQCEMAKKGITLPDIEP